MLWIAGERPEHRVGVSETGGLQRQPECSTTMSPGRARLINQDVECAMTIAEEHR
jgi:hypothetical protein